MEIYAEISHKLLNDIEDLGKDFLWPDGVKWNRKWGSRSCYLECDSNTKETLISFLDNNKISWQEMSNEWEDRRAKKEEKKILKMPVWKRTPKKSRGFINFSDPWNNHEDN